MYFSAFSARIEHFMATDLCKDVRNNFTYFVTETTGELLKYVFEEQTVMRA
jgi:hypothetical protein